MKNQRGVPLEIEIFFAEGVYERGLGKSWIF